ncbi:helix-turn-helix domain-containing protein [Kitasatospora sp. NPDC088548]|uniref:helix-turn-helix domain-containing protein n=1 Tax=Kitasatospora sp. NPDC088548 TaxID=3364075 RepID=UPI0037FC1547
MSLDPILWALKDSPAADTIERLLLITLAERADPDGCNAFPSQATLAKAALCDEKTVGRKLKKLVERKLIAQGDQSAARYIPEWRRPVVYDVLIPYKWFGVRAARVNDERSQRGLPPLTETSRPNIAPAPERARRSDCGVKRKPDGDDPAQPGRGDSQSWDSESPLSSSSAGGTDSPDRGDSESQQGGLTDPQTTPVTHTSNPPHLAGASEQPAVDASTQASGDGKPPRPKTKRQLEEERRAERTVAEAQLNEAAKAGATKWWDHAQTAFGPWAGGSNGFPALMAMIKRALKAGYSKQQVWAALDRCGKHLPAAQQWQEALGAATGRAVRPGSRGQAPMYNDASTHERAEQTPAATSLTQEEIDALLSKG